MLLSLQYRFSGKEDAFVAILLNIVQFTEAKNTTYFSMRIPKFFLSLNILENFSNFDPGISLALF